MLCAHRAALVSELDPGQYSRRRCRRLRHDQQGRDGGSFPDREPGPDEHAAPTQAPLFLRSGDRSGDRAARSDPGRLGAPLPAATSQKSSGRVSERGGPQGFGKNPRGAALSGTGDATGNGRGWFYARPGRRAASGDGGLAKRWIDRSFSHTAHRRHAQAGL